MKARLPAVLAAGALLAATATFHGAREADATTPGVPALDHVFVIVMENTSASSILGNTAQAPYINQLATEYGYASNYYGVTHPSLPNYLALTGGSTFGITTDCAPSTCPVNAASIADRIEASGKTWKAYMESMPSACNTGTVYPYAVKHDPFVYYDDIRGNSSRCQSHVVPYSQLSADLTATSTTPNYVWITPNMCDDMHDCSIGTGDSWLSSQVPVILGSPAFTQQNSLLVLTWDEDDFTGTNHVATIVVGREAKRGYVSSTSYDHYSLLKTVEAAWGLAPLTSNDSAATPMADFFGSPPCGYGSVTASTTSPQPGGVAVIFTATSGGCAGSAEYQFWVGTSRGWKLVRPYSASNSWTLDYAAMPAAGTYTVDVWIKNSGSAQTYDTYALTSWTVGGCNYATTTQAAGLFTTNAGGAGCTNPEYKVWMVGSGMPWSVVRDWSSVNTFTPSVAASALNPGTYTVDVWVRQHGASTDPNYYETWGLATLTVPGGACAGSTPTLAATPTSPQAARGQVSFTASGCGSGAEYEFWMFPGPGNQWVELRSYGSSTYTWDSTALGLTAQNYSIVAWARQVGSLTTTYDSFALYSYDVSGCAGSDVSGSPANPQSAGTTVQITATTQGCPTPEYSLWVLPSGGTWTNVQPYSSSSVFSWTPPAANTYSVVVWAREAGAPQPGPGYETFAATSFTAT